MTRKQKQAIERVVIAALDQYFFKHDRTKASDRTVAAVLDLYIASGCLL